MKVWLSAEGFELTTELDKYATRKLAQLGHHVPRKQKAEAACVVQFSQTERKGSKHCTCAITLTLGDVELKATETTQHMYAALDIAVVRIEQQLHDFVKRQKKRRIRERLRRHFSAE